MPFFLKLNSDFRNLTILNKAIKIWIFLNKNDEFVEDTRTIVVTFTDIDCYILKLALRKQ